MPLLTKNEMITVQYAHSIAQTDTDLNKEIIEQLLDIIDRLRQDYRCPDCCDLGWIGVQNPAQVPGVIMCFDPCQKCNADGAKPNPMTDTSDWKITFTSPEPLRVDGSKCPYCHSNMADGARNSLKCTKCEYSVRWE